MQTPQLNLVFGWLWILLGFLSGTVLGLFFHRDEWLGGYGSFKRRLYRLGHISFFGLGTVNLLFGFTVANSAVPMAQPHWVIDLAAWCLICGGISMPLSCALVAHFPRLRMVFSIPVSSLLCGGLLLVSSLSILRFNLTDGRPVSATAYNSIHETQIQSHR
jgi:hypothetical protein